MSKPIRVLVVDDSIIARQVIAGILRTQPDMALAGFCSNGTEVPQAIERHRPDLITLDVEMPQLNGLGVLRHVLNKFSVPVIVVSSHTAQSSEATQDCLALGAADVVFKPGVGNSAQNMDSYSNELLSKIRQVAVRRMAPPAAATVPRPAAGNASDIIVIGASTGGPAAVTRILQDLPADSPPIVIAIHMPMPFTSLYADRVAKVVRNLRIRHASHREALQPGTAYITPGNQHLLVEKNRGPGLMCHLQPQSGEDLYRPSIDKLFVSVARASGAAAVACVLTGMGNDGAAGARAIFDAGGYVLTQDETSSAIYGMPRVVQNGGYAHRQVPLESFSEEITQALQQRSIR